MDKKKHNKKEYCGRCGKQKGFYIAIGPCGQLHEVCTLCKVEWCTQFNEWEQLNKPLLKPYVEPAEPAEEPKHKVPRPKSKGDGKRSREEVYEQIIRAAENHLWDIMGEYANVQYEEEGGSEAMVSGKVVLKRAEIKDCMFESLSLVTSYKPGKGRGENDIRFNLDEMRVDRKKLVDYWYRTDFK
jgi:hypothetical protein